MANLDANVRRGRKRSSLLDSEPLARVSYEQALANNSDHLARWPRDENSQKARLRPFCIPGIKPTFAIAPDDLIFTIGSCFARNVEQHLIAEGFNVAVTRFDQFCAAEGVKVKSNTLNKFVAHSMLNELRWALEPGAGFPVDSLVEVKDGRFLDMQLASGLVPASRETMLSMRRAVSSYMRMVKEAKVVIVTLGLVEAWYDTAFGQYTNTMPLQAAAERYPGRFEHHVLEYNQLLSALRQMLTLLETYGHPDFRMLLTISPVALRSTFTENDVIVANWYSKSVQRAAAEVICRENPRVDYLPTFESVTHSDRSVAWREDQAHVSTDIVRLNVLRMQRAYAVAGCESAESQPWDQDRAQALSLANRANDLAKAGEAARSDTLFQEAVLIAPNEVLPHVHWGLALYKQRRWEDAARELNLALELGGRPYEITFLLAKSLVKVGQWSDAEKILHLAIDDMPGHAAPPRVMARVLNELGRQEDAMGYAEMSERLQAGAAG